MSITLHTQKTNDTDTYRLARRFLVCKLTHISLVSWLESSQELRSDDLYFFQVLHGTCPNGCCTSRHSRVWQKCLTVYSHAFVPGFLVDVEVVEFVTALDEHARQFRLQALALVLTLCNNTSPDHHDITSDIS